jgi:hypothetical protein
MYMLIFPHLRGCTPSILIMYDLKSEANIVEGDLLTTFHTDSLAISREINLIINHIRIEL